MRFAATGALIALATSGVVLAAAPARADEVFLGGLAHDVSTPFVATPHEGGTADIEFGYRTRRFDELYFLLKPRFSLKAQVNTGGRTSFYTFGLETRKHLGGDRFYIQAGVGVTYQDGYDYTPSPNQAGISLAERASRIDIASRYKSFGSNVLFNPNISLGYELTDRWTVEAIWDHYSHAQIFARQNPGIDTFGARAVYKFGPK